jgi:hypothetical protein
MRNASFVGFFVGKSKSAAKALCKLLNFMAGTTGLEPAASAVTGQRSNQLNYVPACAVSGCE